MEKPISIQGLRWWGSVAKRLNLPVRDNFIIQYILLRLMPNNFLANGRPTIRKELILAIESVYMVRDVATSGVAGRGQPVRILRAPALAVIYEFRPAHF